MLRSVTEYLDATAKRVPEKIAFASEWDSLTFAGLRDASRRVATGLAQRGIFRQPVAVFMEKSAACVSVFLGAAYSGNFYTPLDVKMPVARIEKIMATLQPAVIISKSEYLVEAETSANGIPVLCYEELLTMTIDEVWLSELAKHLMDTDVLYVLFTSGSTGIPKGVVIGHRSVVDYIEWLAETFHFNEHTIFGNQAPFYFDNSVLDIYSTLRTGATCVLIPEEKFAFPIMLLEYLQEHNINTIFWVPSALCLVANLRAVAAKHVGSLRTVLFCGEVMPNRQLNVWRQEYPNALFANLYGPTEITDVCTYYIVDREFSDDEPLPIGKACANTEVMVLNKSSVPVKEGEIGELCVRGTCLAYGYYNQFKKTDEVFVQNPLNPFYPEKIYRTGDLVHYNERGELVYDGRKDFQIKHMGHRIELGEIETAVSSLVGIFQNCCLYDDERKKIVLFYTGNIDENELREKLKGMLPEYMVPSKRIRLEVMPMNLNGKIDRVELKRNL